MIVDVNDYILNLLVMDITGFQLLFPSVQFGEPFVEYSSKFLLRISGICIFIVLSVYFIQILIISDIGMSTIYFPSFRQ